MSAATTEPPVSKARRKHPSLIFEWAASKGHRWRLLFFLNLSLALHVACFYAFKVVYPPTIRQRAETTKVTFLDPREDPSVRKVISQIESRAVFLDGSLRLPIPGASLDGDEQNLVVPVPGFENHEPALRLPPEIVFSQSLPKLFATDDVFLPPNSRLQSAEERPAPFVGEYVYRPQFYRFGEIAELEIVAVPEWADSQKRFAEVDGNSIKFLIEVDVAGRVISCIPWKGIETIFDAEMAQKVETTLSFSPPDSIRRGWLEMRW